MTPKLPSFLSLRRRSARIYRVVLIGLILPAFLVSPVSAQYFGSNKVQFRTFDFQVLKTEHFDVHYYPEAEAAARMAGRMMERWYARLDTLLDHTLRGRQPLILYAAHPHFEQTNAIAGRIGETTGGVTEALRRRIVLPLSGPLADTDHVLGHELVHAYQFDITSDREAGGQGGLPGAIRLPLWFIEGMAEYLSIGPVDPHTAMWMRDAALQERLPTIRDLNNSAEYFPYRWGQAFWSYVAGRWGDEIVPVLLREASRTGSPEQAIENELGLKAEELSAQWQAALRAATEPVAKERQPAEKIATLLTPERDLGGELNVSPALSPDGRLIAFLSERSIFSIDLYIADAETGEIVARLSRTAVDPHLSSLQFANSAGAFSNDGSRFAYTAIKQGRPWLRIYDVENRRDERELLLPDVDEAFNPTWSPDGRRVAIAGMSGGVTDLFVVDLESGTMERLTSDAFSDLQPAWSPDGRRIAFATDRFTSDLGTLAIGNYRLALIDVQTRRIEALRGFENAKHLNPQWADQGRTIYFLSDRGGITNVYRLDVASGEIRQSTDLQTGVTGITATSPALAAALNANRVAFSVYERGAHRLYTSTQPTVITGMPLQELPAQNAAMLPPAERREAKLMAMLEEPKSGLPPETLGEVVDYRPSLSLEAVGAPTVAIGRDRFGTYGGGGIALTFSDMLGDHNLLTAVELNSSFNGGLSVRDIGAAAVYTNLRRRMNWGIYGQQEPYRAGAAQISTGVIQGTPVVIEDTIIFRQTNRAVGAGISYPFNQAQRVEFSAGYRNITFDRQLRSLTFSAITGELLDEQEFSEDIGEPLHFGDLSAALVYDTSIFGATSPVLGQRYRIEASPAAGTINYTSFLLDYRRYFMPATFYTIAVRGLHFGRYGSGGEDERLTPLFLGYPDLVRGYDVGTFDASECGFDPQGGCPAFDRLLGSRLLVGNVEFRFPLLRPFGMRSNPYGPIPVEVALFADGGVAWTSDISPDFAGGDRKGVSSAGVAFRVNALGFAVLEFDFVKPFQRPQQGWMFQFSLTPGF